MRGGVGASASSTMGGVFAVWGTFDLPFDSALLSVAMLVSACENEDRGLSDFDAPGIFERMEPRNEREDSFVSDLLKDGYACNLSPKDRSSEVDEAFLGVLEPSRVFDGCWPMLCSFLQLALALTNFQCSSGKDRTRSSEVAVPSLLKFFETCQKDVQRPVD